MPADAITEFETQLRDKKYASEVAARYGLARAQLRAKNFAAAEREVAALRRLNAGSPMIETLAADLQSGSGDAAAALKTYRDARARFPQDRALIYGEIDAQLLAGRADEARQAAAAELRTFPADARLWSLQAKAYAALGKRLLQHRSQAEVYALQGQLRAAVEQLQIAQKAGDGDFYEQSAVDARLRELQRRQLEEDKKK